MRARFKQNESICELRPWQNPSSRIIRVSRVSGSKDRHSKVWTMKGLRDRRVRLSVSTAIQFYDLQDRLGYDQPSKAVDWLIQAAADAIVELPELAGPFPAPTAADLTARSVRRLAQSKSSCSSASETTSKGSVEHQYQILNKQGSFAELLAVGEVVDLSGGFSQKQMNFNADCVRQVQMPKIPTFETGHSPVMHFEGYNAGEHQELQQFALMQDHEIPVADCNLNFSISSGFAGYSRGTLQSNSPYHHQLVHGGNLPFFLSATLPVSAAAGGGALENQFPGFNGRLQLCCNEVQRHSELKGERKG